MQKCSDFPGFCFLAHAQSNTPLTGSESHETKKCTFPLNGIGVKKFLNVHKYMG